MAGANATSARFDATYGALGARCALCYLRLSQALRFKVSNDLFNFHEQNIAYALEKVKHICDLRKYHNCNMHIGKRIKEAREEAGLTQEELAKAAGVAQSTIGGLESERNPGSSRTAEIAAVLGVEPLWLAAGKGEKRSDHLEIVQIWRDLDDPRRSRLLEIARDLRTAQHGTTPSVRDPFSKIPKPPRTNP